MQIPWHYNYIFTEDPIPVIIYDEQTIELKWIYQALENQALFKLCPDFNARYGVDCLLLGW